MKNSKSTQAVLIRLLSFIVLISCVIAPFAAAWHGMDEPGIARGPGVLWDKTLGGSSYDEAYDIIEAHDGGYIIVGSTQTYGAAARSAYMIKTDTDGNQVWYKTFALGSMAYAHSVKATNDGGYILAGHDYTSANHWDIYLVKTDGAGNLEWHKKFGGSSLDYGYGVVQTRDNGFVAVGVTLSFGAGSYDVYAVKTDSDGNLEWERTYGGIEEEFGYDVKETPDNGLVIVGFTDTFSVGSAEYAVYLIKTDASGVESWYETYGLELLNEGYGIEVMPDGDFAIAGYSGEDACLIRTDPLGNQRWLRKFGGASEDVFTNLSLTRDCAFAMSGYTYSYGAVNADLYVVKADLDGNESWYEVAGGNDRDFGEGIVADAYGHLAITGHTKSFGAGYSDVYLVKIDRESLALDADIYTISSAAGGIVNLSLDAGGSNAGRKYLIAGGVTGMEPGTALPGGLATLPVNFDVFSEYFVFPLLNTPFFLNFLGLLDGAGQSTAQLNVPPIPGNAGITMYFAFCCSSPFDYVSNPMAVDILP